MFDNEALKGIYKRWFSAASTEEKDGLSKLISAAGIGKLGAFVGVFLVPVLQDHIGLRGLLAVAGVSAVLGFAVTGLLPEPAGRTLEDVTDYKSESAPVRGTSVVSPGDLSNPEWETA